MSPTTQTFHPSISPTQETLEPSVIPSKSPSKTPSKTPSMTPSLSPSITPTVTPTGASIPPTTSPTSSGTNDPTSIPTLNPSITPTLIPTAIPSKITSNPTLFPTLSPALTTTTESPTFAPTVTRTGASIPPTTLPDNPSNGVSKQQILYMTLSAIGGVVCTLITIMLVLFYKYYNSKKKNQQTVDEGTINRLQKDIETKSGETELFPPQNNLNDLTINDPEIAKEYQSNQMDLNKLTKGQIKPDNFKTNDGEPINDFEGNNNKTELF